MNLFDIMQSAGGGSPYSALAAQYGLSEGEIAKAVEAFLPAFSAGLKKNTADPLGAMEFMRRLALGDYQRAFQNPAWASSAGRGQGEDALAFLFGSPAVARAVAEQAAAFTGLAREKLTEMMPALAAMMLGGVAQQSTAANPLLDAWMKQFRAATKEDKPLAKGPLDRYEAEQARKESASTADLAAMQDQMMKAGLAALQAGTAAWQKAAGEVMGGGAVVGNPAQPEAGAPGGAIFGGLFEPGLRLSDAYRRQIEALMEGVRSDTTRK